MRRHTLNPPRSILESSLGRIVPIAELRVLDLRGTSLKLERGRTVLHEHGFARQCLVIIEGSLVVERAGHTVAQLGPGEFVGEVALLTGQPRNATVTVSEDCTAYAFNSSEFSALLEECPVLASYVRSVADGRILATAA